ncbi:hypothetical protein OKW43_003379 [Paraburkholderia sp. WC7.3g]
MSTATKLDAYPILNRTNEACVLSGTRKPRMRRSRSRVGWWLFSALVVDPSAGFDEHVPDVCQFGDLRFGGRI